MGANPSAHATDDPDLPVDSVSWTQCAAFNALLNKLVPGAQARFVSEAEWEYACRAGTEGPYGGLPLEQVGWFRANALGVTHAVKQKRANAWGLYDMHGNVMEWCGDVYASYGFSDITDPVGPSAGKFRVRRGGAFQCLAYDCRSAMRFHGATDDHQNFSGFRLCLSAQGRGAAP
jgi:formylglycine-generating enzyme required for sulfatase activity